MAAHEIEEHLERIDRGFDRQAWHGPNLLGALRRLTLEEATFRPNPHRHNAWELAVHCAYWKYAVRRRISGEKRGSFRDPGSNFFPRPDERGVTAGALRDDLALLKTMHRELRATVAALPARRLAELSAKRKWTLSQEIHGIADHDIYHAGQIQVLRRLFQQR